MIIRLVAHTIKSTLSICRNGRRPLHVAVLKNDVETVKVLLQSGADVNRCDSSGLTPLQLACDRGYIGVTETLVGRGALIRHAPGTLPPLILAARGRHYECVELLLGQRANPLVDDGKGNTALTLAVQNNDVLSVLALVQHGAVRRSSVAHPPTDATASNPSTEGRGQTDGSISQLPVDKLARNTGRLMCSATLNKSAQILKALLEAKCPFDVTEDIPHPVIAATATANVECLEVLVNSLKFSIQRNGLPSDIVDRKGESALLIAVMAMVDTEKANYYSRYFSNVYRALAVYDPLILSQERLTKCVMTLVETGFNVEPIWDKFIERFPAPQGITFEQMVLCEVLLQANGLRSQPEHRLRNLSLALIRLKVFGLVRLLHSAGKNPSEAEAAALNALSDDEAERQMHAGISDMLANSRTLKDLCRRSIRRIISRNVLYLSRRLPVSGELQDYICIMDTQYCSYCTDL